MIVFLCKESPEGILTGIYEAGISKISSKQLRLEFYGQSRDLFCEYFEVSGTLDKANKVLDTIQSQLGNLVLEWVYHGLLSSEETRADDIYRFLLLAFQAGSSVVEMLQQDSVHKLFLMNRNIKREVQHLRGFTRFATTKEGILFGQIAPKNNVLPLLAPHFADRLSGENWVLLDDTRKYAAVYTVRQGILFLKSDNYDWLEQLENDGDKFENLWKIFHQSISIPERENQKCQLNMLPLRFRPFMLEFESPT